MTSSPARTRTVSSSHITEIVNAAPTPNGQAQPECSPQWPGDEFPELAHKSNDFIQTGTLSLRLPQVHSFQKKSPAKVAKNFCCRTSSSFAAGHCFFATKAGGFFWKR